MTLRPAARTADLLPPPDRFDGPTSWAGVDDLLRADWLALDDGRGRCLIRVRNGLGLVEHPGLLRARERRGLHRCGYRLCVADDVRVWLWALPDDPSPEPTAPVALAAGLRRWQEHERAVRHQALRTVRDVLGADVDEVAVTLLPEDEWDERDDVDCACCGPGPLVRRAPPVAGRLMTCRPYP